MTPYTEAELEVRLWKEMEKARFGMLGLVGRTPTQHFQPMTAFCEADRGEIWFFGRTDTGLARTLAEPAEAMFVVQAKDQAFQACVRGRLAQQVDAERMKRYWSPVVAAWYPEGRDDPRLTMLCLEAADAHVWLSETNPVAFGLQIARANMTGRAPDVGESRSLDL